MDDVTSSSALSAEAAVAKKRTQATGGLAKADFIDGFLWQAFDPAPWNPRNSGFRMAGRRLLRGTRDLLAAPQPRLLRHSQNAEVPPPQNLSGRADCTCGSAFTFSRTSGGISPSISISATALPPGDSRPTWKVAMLMPACPSVPENVPMKPGLSRLVM